MRGRSGSYARRGGLLTAACGAVLAMSAAVALPAGAADEPALESCVSTLPTPGSENTVLTLDEEDSVTTPGGAVEFTLEFPATDGDGTFDVDGCVWVNGVAVALWSKPDISNGVAYELPFDLPAGAVVGDEVCISAKTTAGPSAPQQSNRKAMACFEVAAPEEEPSEEPTEEPSEEPTDEPSEEPSESGGPVVEPTDPEPTIVPTVLGVKKTKRPTSPTAPVGLPNTGAPAGLLLALGIGLVGIGGTCVARAARYERQH